MTLHTLNTYNAICQLYLYGTEKNPKKNLDRLLMAMSFLLGVIKVVKKKSKFDFDNGLATLIIPNNNNNIELYILNGWIAWYVNYVSIKPV